MVHERSRYIGKELPRIATVKTFADFRASSQAGRDLAHWHLNYETVACHPGAGVVVAKPNRRTEDWRSSFQPAS